MNQSNHLFNLSLIVFICLFMSNCITTPTHQEATFYKVLWDEQDPSYNNYRIPSIIVTPKNTLLAFCEGREKGDTGDIDLLVKRSIDNGKTWSKPSIVWDDSTNTCGNPCPVVDKKTGRIILFMTWNLGTDSEYDIIRKKSTNSRIPYVSYSDDDGVTWSKPKNLLKLAKLKDWGWYATGPGVGIQLQAKPYKGRLVVPCNHSYTDSTAKHRDGFGYGSHVLLSDDGGENWRMSKAITPEVNESQVVELKNGTLLMNMRSYHGKQARAIAISQDGGESWSGISHDQQLIEPVCQASIIYYGKYNENEMFLFANPSTPHDRSHMCIKSSFDNCLTWSNTKLIYQGPSAYSSLTKLPNGNIGLFFEAGKMSPYERLIFMSIPPNELFKPKPLIQSHEIDIFKN